ncbi:hypothetical protein L7F22_055052 [Adiantum nelumboides]|nr:hypothetical protein [Adiantum nelumboides]
MMGMGVATPEQSARVEHFDETAKHIVFFDVETNVPGYLCRSYELLEFGAVVLDARGLAELRSFHTLIRPKDLSCIDRRTTECNTINTATVFNAPTFADVADDIYRLLHGHIWAGHNILKFDILRINEAFSKIGQPAPQPFGVIDTYPLLRRTFGKRAGNYKLATLANYCGFGKQEHRSLADVRMNINVLRSCATMLFLESNYPDIFTTQMEVTTSTSVLEQSASFSNSYPPDVFFGNINVEQEVDSYDRLGDSSSGTRPSVQSSSLNFSRKDTDIEGLEGMNPVRSDLLSAFEHLTLDASDSVGVDCSISRRQTCTNCTSIVVEDEKCISPKLSEVASVFKFDYIPENVLTGYECVSENVNDRIPEDVLTGYKCVSENVNGANVTDVKSKKVDFLLNLSPATEQRSQNESALHEAVSEQDFPDALYSLSGYGEIEAVCTIISSAESSSLAQLSKAVSKEESGGVPFLLASHVILPSIELRSFGSSRTLYYNGFPLQLLEFKVRVRYTINPSYAFDDNGKPRFSILIEPSEAACNVISKCEDLVKSLTASNSEIEWLPSLRKEFGYRAARMRIGTKHVDSSLTYTTEFFRSTSEGMEKIALGPVDASAFRSVLPHGSIIDTGYGLNVFDFHNRTGLMLLAKHIILS